MRARYVWVYLFLKLASDALAINVGFVSAFLLRFKTFDIPSALLIYYKPLLFITVLWLVVLNLAGLYKLQFDRAARIDNLFAVSFGAFSAAFFTFIFVVFMYREAAFSKDIVALGSIFTLVLINISRYLIWKLYGR